jgi:hypothetical protein
MRDSLRIPRGVVGAVHVGSVPSGMESVFETNSNPKCDQRHESGNDAYALHNYFSPGLGNERLHFCANLTKHLGCQGDRLNAKQLLTHKIVFLII